MKKNVIKLIKILSIYLLSLLIFVIIANTRGDEFIQYIVNTSEPQSYDTDTINPLWCFGPIVHAGVIHFILGVILAIYAKVSKEFDNLTKSIIYIFPILTFFLTIPIGVLILYIVSIFQ